MQQQNIGEKISEKLSRTREKLKSKMERAQAKLDELKPQFETLEAEMREVETELEAVSSSEDPVQHARLEVRRERLLAKQERLELRQELLQAKIEGYEEAVSQLTEQWSQVSGLTGLKPEPQPAEDLEAERRKILHMVAEGKITADDAARLLEAMEGETERQAEPPHQPSVVRVRVSDVKTNRSHVNIKLPLGMIRMALRKGRAVTPDIDIGGLTFDVDELEELLRMGVQGHIVDIVDEEDGERVEVLVE
jgi:DNA repair exonuclease SbcCD ATPase subunit